MEISGSEESERGATRLVRNQAKQGCQSNTKISVHHDD